MYANIFRMVSEFLTVLLLRWCRGAAHVERFLSVCITVWEDALAFVKKDHIREVHLQGLAQSLFDLGGLA